MATTIYIVPALTDQAGQCRIVARTGYSGCARDSYRAQPELWKEVGIMNSSGKLVCFDGTNEAREELIACQPLSAGIEFTFPD